MAVVSLLVVSNSEATRPVLNKGGVSKACAKARIVLQDIT